MSTFTPAQLVAALPEAVRKLDPRWLHRNPVMFVVEVGSALTTVLAVRDPSVFAWTITAWLWLTVLFANLAEAVAEGRGKAQAETLRRTRTQTVARRLTGWQPGLGVDGWREEEVSAVDLALDDVVGRSSVATPWSGRSKTCLSVRASSRR